MLCTVTAIRSDALVVKTLLARFRCLLYIFTPYTHTHTHARAHAIIAWDEKRVAQFISEECGLPQYAQGFIKNNITGKIIGLLTKQDLIDIGVKLVGHRIRILNNVKPFQAAKAAVKRLGGIQSWTEFVWPYQCSQFCFPRRFKLTQTGLRIKQDYCCGVGHENTIDLCLVRDVKFHKTCCSCRVQVISSEASAKPNLVFHIWSHRAGKDIYKSIIAAMEANQDRMAGSAFSSTKVAH